jgi:CBS domain-containing protein
MNYQVKDLMVPLSEYATVPMGSTLFEAVTALEKAQEEFDHTLYRHRAVLILDKNEHVVGKLTQMDVLRALEPGDDSLDDIKNLDQFGFSDKVILKLKQRHLSKGPSMQDLCIKAMHLKAADFMQALSEGEYVDESASIDSAIHQLLNDNHFSLLVTRGKEIIGLLRLTDVFAVVFHTMKKNDISR